MTPADKARHALADAYEVAGWTSIVADLRASEEWTLWARKEALAALTTAYTEIDRLREALETLLPTNVSLGNPAWSDKTVVPIDFTLGELRAARLALSLTGAA